MKRIFLNAVSVLGAIALIFSCSGGAITSMADGGAVIKQGTVFAPAAEYWGTQNNNGWYWMVEDKTNGDIRQQSYGSLVSGQFSAANLYAGQRTSKNDAMIPANAYLVFAFRAPSGGKVKFRFNAVAAPESAEHKGRVSMSVRKNASEPVKLDKYDASEIELENDNAIRTYTFSADLKKDSVIYIRFSCDYLHYLWLGDAFPSFSAKYTEINDEAEDIIMIGETYSPDAEKWGEQNNNCWYWMLRDKATGFYSESPYNSEMGEFAAGDKYDGHRASRQDAMIPAGAELVYAFKAPTGGRVDIKFNAVVAPESAEHKGRVTMSVCKNGTEGIEILGYNSSEIEMENDNAIRTYEFTADVGHNSMIYISFSCDYLHYLWVGTPFPTFSATYLSVNGTVDETVDTKMVYAPTEENWGTQCNDGWSWMSRGRTSNAFASLPFNTEVEGQFSNYAAYTDLRISKCDAVIPANADIAFAFTAPVGGSITVKFNAVAAPESETQKGRVTMSVINSSGNEAVIDGYGSSSIEMENDNAIRTYSVSTTVKKNTVVYIVFSCEYSHYLWLGNAFPSFSAKYSSFNDEEDIPVKEDEYTGKTFAPLSESWGLQGANGFYYMYNIKGSNMMSELPFNTDTAFPDCFSYASTHEHLHMRVDGSMHTAPSAGAVLAFKAPVGGKVLVTVKAKGGNPPGTENSLEDMTLSVMKNNDRVYPEEENGIVLPRNDSELGVYSFETDVAKDSMLYAVMSCDKARAGVLQLSVTYLTVNNETDDTYADERLRKVYEVDYSKESWGSKSNNGWSFQFYDKIEKKFKHLAFVTGKNMFTGVTEDTRYLHLLINTYGMTHPALYANPALVFTAPYSGTMDLVIQEMLGSPNESDGTNITVLKNGNVLRSSQPTTAEQQSSMLSVEIVKGDEIAVMLDCGVDTGYDSTTMRTYARYASIDTVQPVNSTPDTGNDGLYPVAVPFAAALFCLLAAVRVLFLANKGKK